MVWRMSPPAPGCQSGRVGGPVSPATCDQVAPPSVEASAPLADGPLLPLLDARDRFEKDYILKVLATHGGNMSRTADALGVERSNLYKKMRAFGIGPMRRDDP